MRCYIQAFILCFSLLAAFCTMARAQEIGYVEKFAGARKSFKNTQTGVTIEFLTTGEYPGDGKPKPVALQNNELWPRRNEAWACFEVL